MNIQDWTLYYDNFGPLSCQAPCTMYGVLYDHGKIPDPFYGTNERELQYLAEKDCVFESVFSAPPALLTREHIELVFHGLDTICHIYLNGTLLGKVKNMHREYVYEVKPLLTAGENTLRLEFKSPRRYFAQQQHKHYLYMNDGDTLPGAAHLRKAMYQSGWDWGPTLPDMGIFRGVELKGWNVDRFDGVAVRQHHENGSVSVELDVTTKCHAGCEIYADFDGKRVLLKNGHGIIQVDNPKLWWARGYGDQPLYDLDVELVCGGEVIDRCHKQLGLRTLTVSTEPDADGKGSEFCFVLNGVKIFSMGANLVPMDNLLSRITDQRWETIVRQAVDANFNTLRVWGGGYYPDSRFYELCDQYGLLVWQDFMVACANIYLTSEMAEEFTQEAICNLKGCTITLPSPCCAATMRWKAVSSTGVPGTTSWCGTITPACTAICCRSCARPTRRTPTTGRPAPPPAAVLTTRTTPPRATPTTGRSGTAAFPSPPIVKSASASAPSTALRASPP